MRKIGTWGGEFELQALSWSLMVNFVIFYTDRPIYVINNNDSNDIYNSKMCKVNIHLAHHLDDYFEHYSSIRYIDD
jgi:hypothetical protein